MSKPLSFGLSLNKKKPGPAKAQPPKRKTAFGGGDSDDEAQDASSKSEQAITELDGFDNPSTSPSTATSTTASSKSKHGKVPTEPPKLKPKAASSAQQQFGDLSSTFTARKHAEAAEELDPSVYDYDAAYDMIKAAEKQRDAEAKQDADALAKPKYQDGINKAKAQRDQALAVAELKKIQREREAEGDEFADKERFVTEAYKKRQEEDKRNEEEQRRREEEDRKKNKFGGMTGFHKEVLEREDQRRAEMARLTAEAAKTGLPKPEAVEDEKTQADLAKEMNAKGAKVAVNEDGEVIDKRELLRGGLNLGAKKKTDEPKGAARTSSSAGPRDQSKGIFGSGGKQGMRERQTRMMEAQLEQALKRSRDEEEEERKKIEVQSKSQKTATDISSAKERFLARKRAAEEARKLGQEAP